ncbi:hypothetical protein [Rheinheimera sp.]|uniref:hypothetical protein n=1 Tax=Rheinheimera sp. TaxID=1869214 RepID=UPI003AF95663
MKNLVKFVAVAMFMFSSVEGYSHSIMQSHAGTQASSQFIANTCPVYPICKQEFESESTYRVEPRTSENEEQPLMANTCPIYPICKQEFESELA